MVDRHFPIGRGGWGDARRPVLETLGHLVGTARDVLTEGDAQFDPLRLPPSQKGDRYLCDLQQSKRHSTTHGNS